MSRRYTRSDAVLLREEDGAFLFDPEDGNLKYLNRSGLELFRLVESGLGVDDIIDATCQKYADVSPSQIRADLEGFIRLLSENGFIRSQDSDPIGNGDGK